MAFGLIGVLPFGVGAATVQLAGSTEPWWVPVIGLSVIAAALAYAVGIVAARMLGATLASFVGLSEVLFAVLFAWLLLNELPQGVQLIGGVLNRGPGFVVGTLEQAHGFRRIWRGHRSVGRQFPKRRLPARRLHNRPLNFVLRNQVDQVH